MLSTYSTKVDAHCDKLSTGVGGVDNTCDARCSTDDFGQFITLSAHQRVRQRVARVHLRQLILVETAVIADFDASRRCFCDDSDQHPGQQPTCLLPTALADTVTVKRSVVSVRPSVRQFVSTLTVSCQTFDHACFACVWIIIIAQRGLKIKVIHQGQIRKTTILLA